MQNVVSWFEIPVKKLDRAAKFYSQVLGVELQPMNNGPKKMMAFPFGPGVAASAGLRVPSFGRWSVPSSRRLGVPGHVWCAGSAA